jgi:hypothetical protein
MRSYVSCNDDITLVINRSDLTWEAVSTEEGVS